MSRNKKPRKPWAERHAQSMRAKARTQAVAQIVTRAESEFQSQILTVRTRLMLAEDGEDATELLAMLAVVIGTPCDFGALVYGRTQWVRQLHGALRTIQAMCLDGYRWRSVYALAIDSAVNLAATQDIGEVTPALRKHWEQAWLDANHFSNLIDRHMVDKDTVTDGHNIDAERMAA
jgi:hypothetical protein